MRRPYLEIYDEILETIEQHRIRKIIKRKEDRLNYICLDANEVYDDKANKNIKSGFRKFKKQMEEKFQMGIMGQ
jgi:hypothetical protein